MSAASLMSLLGGLAQQQQQLPLNYGQLYQGAYAPGFNYFNNQAQNMTNLGGQSMGLYGNLAGQQAQMYQSELPFQMDMAMYNSLAPVLSGLLGQGGLSLPALSPISMQFNRPDVMGGYQNVVNNAYQQAQGYDGTVGALMADQMDRMPTAPYMQKPAAPQAPQAPQAQRPPVPPATPNVFNSQPANDYQAYHSQLMRAAPKTGDTGPNIYATQMRTAEQLGQTDARARQAQALRTAERKKREAAPQYNY